LPGQLREAVLEFIRDISGSDAEERRAFERKIMEVG